MEDGRCRLGLAGRLALVRLIEDGAAIRSAAADLGVAPATAHRWWHRWRAASEVSGPRVSAYGRGVLSLGAARGRCRPGPRRGSCARVSEPTSVRPASKG